MLGRSKRGYRSSLQTLRVLRDERTIVEARAAATTLLENDPTLASSPLLADAVESTIRVANVLISHARARRFRGLVVMDRHLHCQLALREAKGLPRGRVLPWLLRKLPAPDLAIHLDIDPQRAHDRIVARGTDEESLADLTALRDAYRALPEFAGFTVLDAGAAEHQVLADLRRTLAEAENALARAARLKV